MSDDWLTGITLFVLGGSFVMSLTSAIEKYHDIKRRREE